MPDRQSQYPAHLGCWMQIAFCLAFIPLPWASTETTRLTWIIKYEGSLWLWAGGLAICACAMFIGAVWKRASCRHHGLMGCCIMWISSLISYVSDVTYSPMAATFLALLVTSSHALINDVMRKPRGKCEHTS